MERTRKNSAVPSPPSTGLLGVLGRGAMHVGKFAVGSMANQVAVSAWVEFMFAWLTDITPVRLKRLATIVWDAGSHITKLTYTPAGAELGFAARNVVDGLVETIAAPKGRALVLEGGNLVSDMCRLLTSMCRGVMWGLGTR